MEKLSEPIGGRGPSERILLEVPIELPEGLLRPDEVKRLSESSSKERPTGRG